MTLDPERAREYLKTVSRKPLEIIPLDVLLFGDYKLQGGEGRLVNTVSGINVKGVYYSDMVMRFRTICSCRNNLLLWGVNIGKDKEDSPIYKVREQLITDGITNENLISKSRWHYGKREFEDFFSEIK